jgi:hypothetical protein
MKMDDKILSWGVAGNMRGFCPGAADGHSSLPEARAEKVALLREKIESGAYEVNSGAVADRLVDAFIEDLL